MGEAEAELRELTTQACCAGAGAPVNAEADRLNVAIE
eukprot:COSAG01_NODE_930_length_12664_cov_2.440032_5_plen_37_part_00